MNKIFNCWKRFVPHHVERDDDSWDNQNIIEVSFFHITKFVRKKFGNLLSYGKIELNPLLTSSTILDRSANFFIILSFFIVIAIIFFAPSYFVTQNTSEKTVVSWDIIFVVISTSILWTSYVYLFQDFRNLVKTEIVPVIQKTDSTNSKIWKWLVSGKYYEWKSGFGLRLFITTLISLTIFLYSIYTILNLIIPQILTSFQNNLDILTIILSLQIWVLILFLICIISFLIYSIWIVVLFIFMALLNSTLLPEWEIKPFTVMGGTKEFGNLIMHSLYIFTLSLAIFPIISLLPQLERHIPQLQINSIKDLTTFSNNVYSSFSEFPFSSLSSHYFFIIFFILIMCWAAFILIIIHFRIKKRKDEEICILEQEISKFPSTDRVNNSQLQNILCLKEQISNLSEWSINGKNILIEILIFVISLFISHIFF